ncbi:MAG: rhodanese-like domain-containing protein [bacterium]
MKKLHWACLVALCVVFIAAQGCSSKRGDTGNQKAAATEKPVAQTQAAPVQGFTPPKQDIPAKQNPDKAVPASVTNISPEQLNGMLANKEDLIILDVREPQELIDGPAPLDKVVNIPLADLQNRYAELPKDKKIVIVCRSGRRSAIAADFLLKSGYAKIYNLLGGMKAYRESGL